MSSGIMCPGRINAADVVRLEKLQIVVNMAFALICHNDAIIDFLTHALTLVIAVKRQRLLFS